MSIEWCLMPLFALGFAPSATSDPGIQSALAAWRAEHGAEWQLVHDPETGFGRLHYNGAASLDPVPFTDPEFAAAALEVLAATESLHGLDPETLVRPRVIFLPLAQVGTTDKIAVELRQEVAGVPVIGGSANVLFDARGLLLSVDTTGLPQLGGFDVQPSLAPAGAVAAAVARFEDETGMPVTRVSDPELAIEQILRAGARQPVLAWRVDVRSELADLLPEGFVYSIDAHDGSVARREPSVHHDVSGNVQSLVSPGDRPDTPANPEAPDAMRRIQVTSAQGNALTDADGDFTIAGATPPLVVTLTYEGTHAQVINAAGGNHVLAELLTQSSGNDLLMNPNGDPLPTAEANAFNWINRLRDWTRSINPTDGVGEFQALANVNLPGPCNAFYDGFSVNFFIENLCVNSAYSTVIVHEMGHWYNDNYNSGNGSDGFGEGNADVYAMYILDTPIVGRDFEGPGQHIRTGNNNRQFCGDCCGGCHGEVHVDGEVLMGALWKVHARLQTSHGAGPGAVIAESLFNAWMNAYNDGQIKTIIETHWLVLDDDDGNVQNGTPHYLDIDGGFRQQGFPGVDIDTCPQPTNYCVAAPNSAGPGDLISSVGSTSIGTNDFTLQTTGGIPGQFGLFYYGPQEVQVPFGDGFRCIGGSTFRLNPPILMDGFGDSERHVDFTQPPANGGPGAILAGSTWKFQHWYRNPGGPGGTGFNLSNGLSATFCQ